MKGWHQEQVGTEIQRRLDPYIEWGRSTGFRHLFPEGAPREFPVVLQLKGMTASAFWAEVRHRRNDWGRIIAVPDLYRNPSQGLEAVTFCTATVTEAFFSRLVNDAALRKVIRRVELSLPIPHYTQERMVVMPPPGPVPEVVVGVIDDGIAFAHAHFRMADGSSRFAYFWNQDAEPPAGSVAYGREFSKGAPGPLGIDAAMAAATHAGMVDEDEVYCRLRHLDTAYRGPKPMARRVTHGTHVADLAAGYDAASAPAARPIIGVQLPVQATRDTTGAHFGRYALDGLHYILDRAQLLAPSLPVVANISYGFIAGPHNGTSVVEAAIDEIIALRPAPLAVVLPAGNSFLARCHATLPLPPAATRKLDWRVQPQDLTASYLEIWLPPANAAGQPARVSVRIKPPGGAWSPWINEGQSWSWQPAGQVLCEAVYHNAIAPGRDRNMILVALSPTAALEAGQPLAPAGVWEIQFKNVGPQAMLDAWIQRDDSPFGYPASGRQSYFDDNAYVRVDGAGRELELDNASYVKRRGTISSIATGARTIVIGGFHRKDWRAAKYSASGPLIHPPAGGLPTPDGPVAMAVSDDSCAHRGVLAAGSRSGSCVVMNGTSVAAPQITRWIADQMAMNGLPVGRQEVFQFAQSGTTAGYRTEANPPPGAVPQPPVERSGGGRIEAPPRVPRARFER